MRLTHQNEPVLLRLLPEAPHPLPREEVCSILSATHISKRIRILYLSASFRKLISIRNIMNNDISEFAKIIINYFRNNCRYPLNNDISKFAESPAISTPDYAS